MSPALDIALQDKTPEQLLDILVMALIDNDEKLLAKLTDMSSNRGAVAPAGDVANAALIQAVVKAARNRVMAKPSIDN